MNRTGKIIFGLIVIAAVLVAAWWWFDRSDGSGGTVSEQASDPSLTTDVGVSVTYEGVVASPATMAQVQVLDEDSQVLVSQVMAPNIEQGDSISLSAQGRLPAKVTVTVSDAAADEVVAQGEAALTAAAAGSALSAALVVSPVTK